MTTKHTTGKWQMSKNVNDYSIYSNNSDAKDIATAYQYSRNIPEEEARANATLIAAAPELLEMCIATLEDLESGELAGNATQSALINLKQAIYKATENNY